MGDEPAFPGDSGPYYVSMDGEKRLRSDYGIPDEPNLGMTKREYFAAMAMQAMLSNPHCDAGDPIGRWAVQRADELLAELND